MKPDKMPRSLSAVFFSLLLVEWNKNTSTQKISEHFWGNICLCVCNSSTHFYEIFFFSINYILRHSIWCYFVYDFNLCSMERLPSEITWSQVWLTLNDYNFCCLGSLSTTDSDKFGNKISLVRLTNEWLSYKIARWKIIQTFLSIWHFKGKGRMIRIKIDLKFMSKSIWKCSCLLTRFTSLTCKNWQQKHYSKNNNWAHYSFTICVCVPFEN